MQSAVAKVTHHSPNSSLRKENLQSEFADYADYAGCVGVTLDHLTRSRSIAVGNALRGVPPKDSSTV